MRHFSCNVSCSKAVAYEAWYLKEMRDAAQREPHLGRKAKLVRSGVRMQKLARRKALGLLLNALEIETVSSTLTTPSERSVIRSFHRWARAVEAYGFLDCELKNPAFFYTNMNTGANLLFVAWYGYEEYALKHFS